MYLSVDGSADFLFLFALSFLFFSSFQVVLLARAAAGVFVCVLLVAVCAYLAEISTASSRGKFIAAVEICQAAGEQLVLSF